MTTFLYFAYGSNMLAARLTARCMSARKVCNANAEGYSLVFTKPSDDRSGKGHLLVTNANNQPGVLFEINIAERAALDEFEGAGHGYERTDHFPVRRCDNGQIVVPPVSPDTRLLGLGSDELPWGAHAER